MKPTALSSSLACALLAGLTLATRIAAWPLVGVALPEREAGQAGVTAAMPLSASESAGGLIVARDPFRATRRPALLAYDPLRVGQPLPPPVPKPTLALEGIVWDGGVNPTALVEGFAGIEGARVVRRGDVVGDLRVKDIRRDRVVIVGPDAVWTLTVKELGK